MMNMYWEPLDFDLPEVAGRKWYRVADTSLAAPNDIVDPRGEAAVSGSTYAVAGRSVVVLVNR
jgi:glycogen operon protein